MKVNKRVPTAIVFAVVFLGLLFLSRDFFSILLSVFTAIGIIEYYRLISFPLGKYQRILGVVAGIAVNQIFYAFKTGYIDQTITSNVLSFFLMAAFFFAGLGGTGSGKLKQSIAIMSGVFYVAFPFGLTHFITFYPFGAEEDYSPQLLLGLVSLIWANDIFAYYAGSMWGKRKIMPKVSPKKTWEGFAGGLIASILTGLLLSGIIGILSPVQWLVSAGIASVFGTTGDFMESYLKRRAGVKDSGTVLPGHGGILDRFDAYLLAIPVMVFYLYGSA